MMIIAEAGTSHGGSLDMGFKLIEKAADSGADCIKFQAVFADEIVHPLSGKVTLPGGKISLYDEFKQLEKGEEFFTKLKQEAEKCGLIFLATPFGIKSAQMLKNMDVSMMKIASPELNHFSLLEEVSKYGIPLILSGGVSMLSDIEKAVEITGRGITFLHCVTSYPAPEEDYNLLLIKTLSSVFGFKTGVSDHSKDPLLVPLISAALGASALEKHITLDNTAGGLDDLIALNPADFKMMTEEIRKIESLEAASGAAGETPVTTGTSAASDRGKVNKTLLEELEKRFGSARVNSITGDGIKRLAPSEKGNYRTTNRSLLALRTIESGETLGENDFAPLRSEKNLLPGLTPDFARIITGKTVRKKIENGTGITFEYLL